MEGPSVMAAMPIHALRGKRTPAAKSGDAQPNRPIGGIVISV